jgi:hypothetical protein
MMGCLWNKNLNTTQREAQRLGRKVVREDALQKEKER